VDFDCSYLVGPSLDAFLLVSGWGRKWLVREIALCVIISMHFRCHL
jgi:hypothetical protein